MTKTEAAEIIATQAIVFARRTGQPITMLAIDEHMCEAQVHRAGTMLGQAAAIANRRTVARTIRSRARSMGETHLLAL